MKIILLIEDTKSIIDLINLTLTENNYLVSIALNGKQGVKIAEKLRPDLILLDILMPEMDGFETCRLLKSNNLTKDIPVVFISALAKASDKVKAFQVGGVDYVNKPIETDELLARIKTHLTIKNLQSSLQAMNDELESKVKQRTGELEIINQNLVETVEELYNKSAALIQSEERYKYITESITDYIYKVSIQNKTIVAFSHSSTCEVVTGFTPEELNSNVELFLNTIYDEDRQKYTAFVNHFLEHPNNNTIEHRIITKNGEVKWVSNTILGFIDKEGRLFEYNGLIKDITERKNLEKEILSSIIETEEKEKLRFSQELHDGLGPILSSAKMYLQWISQTTDKDDIPNLIIKTTKLIDEAYKSSREIAQKLSPHVLQNFGLIPALKNFIDNNTMGNKINIILDHNTIERFDIQKETIIYRVITESINNTLKHANANEIKITVRKELDKLSVQISDNGTGFDVSKILQEKTGLGLFNMKNRIEAINGTYMLESVSHEGTKIHVQVNI